VVIAWVTEEIPLAWYKARFRNSLHSYSLWLVSSKTQEINEIEEAARKWWILVGL